MTLPRYLCASIDYIIVCLWVRGWVEASKGPSTLFRVAGAVQEMLEAFTAIGKTGLFDVMRFGRRG